MRTTIDLPEPLYRELKIRAATEGSTIKEIILDSLALTMRTTQLKDSGQRPRLPVLSSQNPGSLHLGEEGVYEYIPFP